MDFTSWAAGNESSFQNAAACNVQGEQLTTESKRVESIESQLLEGLFRANPGCGFTVYDASLYLNSIGVQVKEQSLRARLSNLCTLSKYFRNGLPAVIQAGKRLDQKFSRIPNTVYKLNQ